MNDRTIDDQNRTPSADEIAAENLRRYVELAIEIERSANGTANLTQSETGGSVSEGLVDPSTFKTTG